MLAELAALGLVTVGEKSSIWRSGKVHAAGVVPADLDPVLAEALATVAQKERTASALVTKLGKGLDDRLAAGLAERRILERRDGKRLGADPADHLAGPRPDPRPPATARHHGVPR